MELGRLAFTIQALAVPLVAALLLQLARTTPRKFLRYWAAGWVLLSVALTFLWVADQTPRGSFEWRWRQMVYCCLEYSFGFLLWAGCRELATGETLRLKDLWLLAPALAFGLVAPWAFRNPDYFYPLHAPIFGVFFLISLVTVRKYRPATTHPMLGVRVVEFCLLVLGVAFLHYGPVCFWIAFEIGHDQTPLYMRLSPAFDALLEAGLGLGMAMLVTELVREELAAKNFELAEANRRLAEATEQLAVAARTDALTGLLNRGGLEALLAEKGGGPFAGSVAVIDLNNLKQLNDRFGHDAGDAAIRIVARELRAKFRITDPLVRSGGDEFLVLFVGGKGDELGARLRVLDDALKGHRLPGADRVVDLVVAWGTAEFAAAADLPAAITRADHAMYECKAARKDVSV
jgi:diguanylate cyclase (GGDEF)-like protein